MDKRRTLFVVVAALFLALPATATDFYVTPAGTSEGDGSAQRPWSLAKALDHPASVKPGDTIWLRAGTYIGPFVSQLRGTPERPIVVRNYPGERVTLDGNYGGKEFTLNVRARHTWFWGLEVTNSDTTRSITTEGSGGPPGRGTGVALLSRGSKLINMVIHDAAQGVISNDAAPDGEINGCLIYYNGYDAPDRGHGHGIYVQNETGIKRVIDNIIFQQFGWGIHGYTEGAELDNMYFEGNTAFNNGLLSDVSGARTNFLIGANGAPAPDPESSTKVAKNTSLVRNYSYFSGTGGVAANLGYNKGIASPTLLDNYLIGGTSLALVNAFRPITMTGNTLLGNLSGFESTEFPGNTYLSSRPTGNRVFVRPNDYEPGRANITVYNWDRAGTVGVSLKGILEAGTAYEVRNAQNFYGPPVLSGVYDGSASLQLPMTGLVPATPVGLPTPSGTGPDFQVFVVVPKPPSSHGKRPAASFSFAPGSPGAGQAVSFADLSGGNVDSHSWDFGDAVSGAANRSTDAAPTHTFSAPGTYLVRLTVANSGGSSTRARLVTIAASPGTHVATLPVAGHVLGATGQTFVTDVAIENPTSETVAARLVFSASGGDPPLETSVSLSPGETRLLADVAASEFGVTNSLGSLRVETEGSPAAPLRVAGRTYVDDGGATLGLGAVGLTASGQGAGVRYLSNLALSETLRTNVGALNASEETQVFTLELRAGSGNIVGRATLSLAAGEQRQWSLSQLFPRVTGTGLTAHIRPAGGSLAPIAYAAVTDNASSDPTYYTALTPSPVQYLPGVAGITGYGDAFFRSEIAIANSGHEPATLTLTFLEHDRSNASGARTTSVVLGPHETLHTDDALQTLFGLTETYGALLVVSDASPGITVFERILTDATRTAGTVGQQVDAIAAEQLFARGSLLGIRQDDAFRTNVGLLNPNPVTATATLRLVASPATELATATVSLPPRGYIQRNLAALFPSVQVPGSETLSIHVDGGGRAVFAFASVIDNVSQDPTYYPEQP